MNLGRNALCGVTLNNIPFGSKYIENGMLRAEYGVKHAKDTTRQNL